MKLRISYSAIDGFRTHRTFRTLAGASAFARGYVGDHPEMSRTYAISGDGVGKITYTGCTLAELFPAPTERTSSTSSSPEEQPDECDESATRTTTPPTTWPETDGYEMPF